MIERIAQHLAEKLEAKGMIVKDDIDFYRYGIEVSIERIFAVGSMLLIALAWDRMLAAFCFMLFFFSLRHCTGGFHANTFLQCYIASLAMFAAVLVLADTMEPYPYVWNTLFGISVAIIWFVGTVNHPNMDMDAEELQVSKKSARALVLLEVFVIVSFLALDLDSYHIACMEAGVILCAAGIVLAKLFKQEVR